MPKGGQAMKPLSRHRSQMQTSPHKPWAIWGPDLDPSHPSQMDRSLILKAFSASGCGPLEQEGTCLSH